MNVVFWENHQGTSFDKSHKNSKKNHAAVLDLISKFTNEELFEKKNFLWTGTTNLGSYCVSATSSHTTGHRRK